ncbi:putative Ig domain-containing protein [Pyxidicoccus parkwayensis]|uniref:Ig domain-containing protein n=1 Tax=Pyxidicoccus parkwayensis TaxID=2813578 RepID=A0ABX7PDJ4_9BACT|nr:putative Ig domain-containing protein [Pyxidicoccus parkwaysis]
MPSGLTLSNSGEIAGTPSAPGSSSFTVEVRDSSSQSARKTLSLEVIGSGFDITTASLPDAYLGNEYTTVLTASGGTPPYVWVLASGTLPSGVRLGSDGHFGGAPVGSGAFSVTLSIQDASGLSVQRDFSLSVFAPPSIAGATLDLGVVGAAYSASLSASGGRAPLSLRIASGSLPEGLRLEGSSIVGTPSAASTASFTVEVQDANSHTASASFQLTVRGVITVTPTTLPGAYTDAPYSKGLTAAGGQPPYTWVLTQGSLPSGLRLLSSGAIEGTASTSGTSSFTVRVTDSAGDTDTRAVSLTVYAPPTVTTSSLADGYVGTSYAANLTVSGGASPQSWSVDSGALPQGLALTSSSGAITGIPSGSTGTSSVTFRVTDGSGRTATRALSVTVYRVPSLSGPSLQLEGYASESFSATYVASDGKPPYTFSTQNPLPSWLTLTSSGKLQGTPSSAGTTSGQVRISDVNGRTGSRDFSLTTYLLPTVTTSSLPEGRGGQSYSASLLASGGKGQLTWSIASGSLPMGLDLTSTGSISGIPTSGTSSFTARVTDVNGRFAERSFTLTVYLPPLVTTTSLPDAVKSQPYSTTLTATNGRAPLTWSFTGSLPAGLSLSSSGILSGTPTSTGSSSFSVTVKDADGVTDSRSLSLTVRATSSLLTVGQWNIEWFGAPNQGPPNSTSDGGVTDDLQVSYAREVLGDAGVNVWGLVEMVDTADFATIKAQLPGYSGFLANDVSYVPGGSSWYSAGEQKPGVLYDSSLTYHSAQLILTSQAADFGGRPPLRVDFTVRVNGSDVPLTVIVLHMKAFDDEVSYGQRQRAGTALKSYLDTVMPTDRVLVIGDWNDDVDRSITRVDGGYLASPFEPFVLDSSHYTFITQPLSLAGERTTVEYRDAIDHTLATNEMAANYLSGTVRVLRPDVWIPDYVNTVSDHYPVISRYDLGGGGSPPSEPVLFLNEVLANEPSIDGGVGDPHYEFIEVLNVGATSADLSGWSLWDSAVMRHVFPSGTSLAPGRAFVVYGGPRAFPAGAPNTQAASTGQLGLNNDGDTASLRAPDGGIVDLVSYTSTVDNVSINRAPDGVPDAGFVLHNTLNPGLGSSAGRRADGGAF